MSGLAADQSFFLRKKLEAVLHNFRNDFGSTAQLHSKSRRVTCSIFDTFELKLGIPDDKECRMDFSQFTERCSLFDWKSNLL